MRKLLLLLIPVLLLTSCTAKSGTQAQQSFIAGNGAVTFIKPGDRVAVPVLSGTSLNGTTYTLPAHHLAVVNVWASWCSPCRAEEPTLSALAKKYSEVNFVGILTRDNPVSAEAFTRKRGTPYPTLIDDALLIGLSKTLPANAIPTTLVIDKNGKVAGRISGAVTVDSLSQLIEKVSAE